MGFGRQVHRQWQIEVALCQVPLKPGGSPWGSYRFSPGCYRGRA